MPDLSLQNFKAGAIIATVSGLLIIAVSFLLGKTEFFYYSTETSEPLLTRHLSTLLI